MPQNMLAQIKRKPAQKVEPVSNKKAPDSLLSADNLEPLPIGPINAILVFAV